MKNNINHPLQEYSVCLDTSFTAYLKIQARDPEEARQIVSDAFAIEDGDLTAETLCLMNQYRNMIGFVSPHNAAKEIPCTVGHSVRISGAGGEHSKSDFTLSVMLREKDFDNSDTDHTCGDDDCPACSCCDSHESSNCCPMQESDSGNSTEKCMLYLLNKPAELIPMESVAECALELGKHLTHERIPGTPLFLTFNPCSILDVEDTRYLIAPALVYGLVNDEPVSMNDEECVTAQMILADRTVTLTADREEFHALKLWG